MGRLKELNLAERPPLLKTFTEIHAPDVKKERVNGKDKWSLTNAKAGPITIYSDDDNERDHASRSRGVKRERSQISSRAVGHRHRSKTPAVKQEPSADRQGRQQSSGQTSPAAVASGTRQPQIHEPLRRRDAQVRSGPPSDSSSSSDTSDSDSSDSSESEDESGSSSDSSSSNGSSSGDEASSSVYRPSTPASSIGSSPIRTRRKREADIRVASDNPAIDSPSRLSLQSGPSIGSRHAPVNFFIPIPSQPLPRRPEQDGRPRSQTSSAVVPTGVHPGRTPRGNRPRPNSSPVVLGFMPINRSSPPPRNAPTEPRAMRTRDVPAAGAPSRVPQRTNIPSSGSSALPFRGVPSANDSSQQKDQQRRGPARPGRIMQTVEQQPVDLLNTRGQPRSGPSSGHLRDATPGPSSSHLRAATPGPSSRRTAPPQPSPGIFVTPRSVSVRAYPVPRSEDSSPTTSRSRGKRVFDETDCPDPAAKAMEMERVLEKIKSHEMQMEQQRAQLEDTKRLLAEQKTRIDDLEQRRRAEQHAHDLDVRMQADEQDVAPPPEVAPRDVAIPSVAVPHDDHPRPVARPVAASRDAATPAVAVPRHLAPPRDIHFQVGGSNRRKRRRASHIAQVRLREQKRQQLEQERQEDLELEQQLEQEQRRAAERTQGALRRPQNNAQGAPPQLNPRAQAAAQKRIQDEVFNRPLSGCNPRIIFDDDDRPHISEATAFLMRLPQAFVLTKLRKLIEGKPFFDMAHPGSVHMGCWVVRSTCDMRMKLMDSGEKHGFTFPRLAVRLWHDEQSIYSLVQHHKHRQKAVHTCHNEQCMHPEHIVVEPSSAAVERRRCKREGWCPGHEFVHKDGTRQARKSCIFAPQNAFLRH